MGYAQLVRSPKGDYYIGRYTDSTGKRGTPVAGQDGKPARYKLKRDAKKAAEGGEAATREGRLTQAGKQPEVITFSEWADKWYAAQRLKQTTMANYRSHLALAVARFGDYPMTDEGFPSV